jgi:hypothetical protein
MKALVSHRIPFYIVALLFGTAWMVLAESYHNRVDEDHVYEEIELNRSHTVTRLLRVIENGNSSQEAKIEAVHILGDLRAEEAVPIFLSNLDLGAGPVVLKGEDPFRNAFPVKHALEKKGKPAVPYILKHIRKTEDPQKLWQLTFTLASITGSQEGSELLKQLLESDHVSNVTKEILQAWIRSDPGKHELKSETEDRISGEAGGEIPAQKDAAQNTKPSRNDTWKMSSPEGGRIADSGQCFAREARSETEATSAWRASPVLVGLAATAVMAALLIFVRKKIVT